MLKKKAQDSSYSGRDKEKAFIPASTFRALTGDKYVDNIVFQAANASETKAAHRARARARSASASASTRTTRKRCRSGTRPSSSSSSTSSCSSFNAFLGIIGVLTLIVGGIGVSNIMNVVVEERTREIGIKMALGAKQRWILTQFLLETLLVTAVGGAIGFAISLRHLRGLPAIGAAASTSATPELSPIVAIAHGASRWASSDWSRATSRRATRRGSIRSWR